MRTARHVHRLHRGSLNSTNFMKCHIDPKRFCICAQRKRASRLAPHSKLPLLTSIPTNSLVVATDLHSWLLGVPSSTGLPACCCHHPASIVVPTPLDGPTPVLRVMWQSHDCGYMFSSQDLEKMVAS
ncbi:hypothetical protein L208DRAFT_1388271 [Tricholoma matsutake]|nr:hypothetical protein L208DRAFT_1388271 [Tricholoma matsutake 945]